MHTARTFILQGIIVAAFATLTIIVIAYATHGIIAITCGTHRIITIAFATCKIITITFTNHRDIVIAYTTLTIMTIAFRTHRIIAIAFCNLQDLHDCLLHNAVPYEVTIAYCVRRAWLLSQAEFVTQSLLFLEEVEGGDGMTAYWAMIRVTNGQSRHSTKKLKKKNADDN